MDQVKIGKFIAAERKARNWTQQQLADRLHISGKTVSKWETGGGLPEISLLMPLCEELDLTVNELLSAQRLTEAEYKTKAEGNIMDFLREREENRKKFWLTFIVGMVATVSFVTLLLVVTVYGEVMSPWARVALVVIACCVFTAGLYVAAEGERTVGWYKCPHCGETFVPSFRAYLWSPHMWTTRHLRCPACGKKSWCKKRLGREE